MNAQGVCERAVSAACAREGLTDDDGQITDRRRPTTDERRRPTTDDDRRQTANRPTNDDLKSPGVSAPIGGAPGSGPEEPFGKAPRHWS